MTGLPLAKIEALDLVIMSMQEAEKDLDKLISKAENLVNLLMTLTAKVTLKDISHHEKYRIDLEIGKEEDGFTHE